MTTALFPRIDPIAVDQCLTHLDTLVAEAGWRLTPDRYPASTGFAASGGGQADSTVLTALREQVVAVASECGFPDRGSVADRSRFDRLASAVLADFTPLRSGEADRDDVWAFIATVLMPDVAQWRFSGRSADRFHGGIRNTFQRLWMRARALDCGKGPDVDRWQFLDALTEDALVQLTERPSIGADPRLCRAIAAAWVETSARIGKGRMEDVMRRAIIDLRIRNEIQMLGALSETILRQMILDIFLAVAASETGEDHDLAQPSRPPAPADDDASGTETNGATSRLRSLATSIFKRT